ARCLSALSRVSRARLLSFAWTRRSWERSTTLLPRPPPSTLSSRVPWWTFWLRAPPAVASSARS
ncbi:hypothetical protein BN1708_019708, partial [Verticillium longisporum]